MEAPQVFMAGEEGQKRFPPKGGKKSLFVSTVSSGLLFFFPNGFHSAIVAIKQSLGSMQNSLRDKLEKNNTLQLPPPP